jgi:hypothetical protein
MKTKNLHHFDSEQAPKEWRDLLEIKAAKPTQRNVEISLQKLDGLNICIWMVSNGGMWKPASDFFHVKK